MQDLRRPAQMKISISGRDGIVVVLLIAIALRLGLWSVYQPISYGDSPSYRRAAEAVLDGFVHYDGTRTPGYPVFMALLGSDERIWIAQMALGVVISLLMYYIALQLSGQPLFSVIAGLAHSFNLEQLFFEANLLTETLTTLWIMLTLAGVMLWLLHPEKRSIPLAVSLGLTSVFALITRPLFIFFPFWLLLVLLYGRWSLKTFWHALAILFPVLLIAGSWVGFIQSRFGDWSLTTMNGYHLMQHTGGYFELAPDEYAELRDTYIEFRDRRIAETGTQTNAIWDAIPAMQKASGLNFYDLSRTLAQVSVRLILEHPVLYLKNVAQGWWMFWLAPVYWVPEALSIQSLAALLEPITAIQRYLLAAANIFFIITSLLAVAMHRRLALSTNKSRFLWCLVGTIWITSIFQTLLDHGDNPRFLVPLQSLVVMWVLWVAWAFINKQLLVNPANTQEHK